MLKSYNDFSKADQLVDKDKKILTIITNETQNVTDKMEIVTPSIYASVFSKFAQEHKQNLDNENELSHEVLQEECAFLTDLQSQTSKNANILSKNTTAAISAIKDKNDAMLTNILKETEALRLEVEKLKESVYHDELTHTYNRKWLHDNFINSDDTSLKTEGTLAIIDLNYFKLINDTHGHIIGDKVLIFMANRLKTISHNVVRYGGDEFIIMFPKNISVSESQKLLNKTREGILSKKLKAHKEMFTLSFSFGVTGFKENETLSQVIENADKNMYEDKVQIKKRIKGI